MWAMLQIKVRNGSWMKLYLIHAPRIQTCGLWSETIATIAGGSQEAYFAELYKAMAGGIRVKYSQSCLPCQDLNLSHLLLYGEITSFIVACLLPASFAIECTQLLLPF